METSTFTIPKYGEHPLSISITGHLHIHHHKNKQIPHLLQTLSDMPRNQELVQCIPKINPIPRTNSLKKLGLSFGASAVSGSVLSEYHTNTTLSIPNNPSSSDPLPNHTIVITSKDIQNIGPPPSLAEGSMDLSKWTAFPPNSFFFLCCC